LGGSALAHGTQGEELGDKAKSLVFFNISNKDWTWQGLFVGLRDKEPLKVPVDGLPLTLLMFAEGTEARMKLDALYAQEARLMWPVCLTDEERENEFKIPPHDEQHTSEVPEVKGACIVQDENEDVVGFQLDGSRIMLTDETREKFAAAFRSLKPPYEMTEGAKAMLDRQFPLQ
jgi:hypothetical protein